MPEASIAFPPKRMRALVTDELQETFARVAARGSMRLGVAIDPAELRQRIEAAPAPAPPPVERARVEPAPAPAPPRVAVQVAPAPAPPPALFPRRVSLGAMEEPNMNRTTTVQMGALDPSIFRTRVRAQVTPINIVPRVGTQDIRGYPTLREEDEPDWTTYAMIGGLVLVVGGGIYLAKKRKMF